MAAIGALARNVGALVFVDASQVLGALPVGGDLQHADVLASADHKFLMHAGRGRGYCYLSPRAQKEFVPINAGWKAGAVPVESFFGPRMELSSTASRFDNSISWVAAVGNEAALSAFDDFGADAIFARNAELTTMLHDALNDAGWETSRQAGRQSSIVSVPVRGLDVSDVVAGLRARRIACSARDGNLRLAVHFYNHEDEHRASRRLPRGAQRATVAELRFDALSTAATCPAIVGSPEDALRRWPGRARAGSLRAHA